MHNTAPCLLAQTKEECLSSALPGCTSSFWDIKGAVTVLFSSQEVKEKQQPFIFSGCARPPTSLLGCCAHCRVSAAAEISVVTAGQGTCQEAQEINGTAAMLMLSPIMQLKS